MTIADSVVRVDDRLLESVAETYRGMCCWAVDEYRGPDGKPLTFEAFLRTCMAERSARGLANSFGPVGAGRAI